ncbi:MAG: FliI/YscN family ATPase [Planctomycetes bacterium]|nr:FliI/YscN family ATPase [Planctomycetota bacterium]
MNIAQLRETVEAFEVFQTTGKVRSSRGVLLSCTLPAAVGDRCQVVSNQGRSYLGEVIGFSGDMTYVVLFEHAEVHPGMSAIRLGQGATLQVGDGLLGRIVDGLGRPIDTLGALTRCVPRHTRPRVPPPLERDRIRQVFETGQRAIDGLLTLGRGQRVGIFAGSGVGKSTLLGEIAKNSAADVNVIALIGERGREVRPFIDDCLGSRGLAKSVVVVATCDQTPLLRIQAAHAALTFADHFRDQGAHVLLLCDSLTRLAMAQRELGLALGEPPSARSYTPSVFQLLANLVERMGNSAKGSITGILTVLVEGGDMDEPIADAVRSLVDGHIVLDRRLAEAGHYPAIRISQSISRAANEITEQPHQTAVRKINAVLATYAEAEDLIRIGAYVPGTSPPLDRAMDLRPAITAVLRQPMGERTAFAETRLALEKIATAWPY